MLHCVVRPAHDLGMVKFLLSRGADPDLQNADGLTAIGAAAQHLHLRRHCRPARAAAKAAAAVIEYLAQAGADLTRSAAESGRSRLKILTKCCTAKAQTATQRRICEVFGL
jgi:hypothetical protein